MYTALFWEMSLFVKTFIGEATGAKLKCNASISFILGNVILYWHKPKLPDEDHWDQNT